jgi:hypothetical protein
MGGRRVIWPYEPYGVRFSERIKFRFSIGPPLFLSSLSHSASPAYDETDHIIRLKAILEAEVFEIVEGEFSLGQSTEALSRGRIHRCDLFVSFLWPREDFRKADGPYSLPE